MQLPVYIVSGGGGADLTGHAVCDTSQIPMDGFRCLGLITAYQFIDIVADTDDKNNLTLTCKVLGLPCDLTEGLPDDDAFERQFVNDRLEVIDDFTFGTQRLFQTNSFSPLMGGNQKSPPGRDKWGG